MHVKVSCTKLKQFRKAAVLSVGTYQKGVYFSGCQTIVCMPLQRVFINAS